MYSSRLVEILLNPYEGLKRVNLLAECSCKAKIKVEILLNPYEGLKLGGCLGSLGCCGGLKFS